MTEDEKLIEERAEALSMLYKEDPITRAFIDHLMAMMAVGRPNKESLLILGNLMTVTGDLFEKLTTAKGADLN